jgi:hypothetical protein
VNDVLSMLVVTAWAVLMPLFPRNFSARPSCDSTSSLRCTVPNHSILFIRYKSIARTRA